MPIAFKALLIDINVRGVEDKGQNAHCVEKVVVGKMDKHEDRIHGCADGTEVSNGLRKSREITEVKDNDKITSRDKELCDVGRVCANGCTVPLHGKKIIQNEECDDRT